MTDNKNEKDPQTDYCCDCVHAKKFLWRMYCTYSAAHAAYFGARDAAYAAEAAYFGARDAAYAAQVQMITELGNPFRKEPSK